MKYTKTAALLGLALTASAANASTILTFTDKNPGSTGEVTFGITGGAAITDPAVAEGVATSMSHVVTTAEGGTFTFTITATQAGGTAVYINNFGNWSVQGGSDDRQIDSGEALTLTGSVSNFGGGLTAGDVSFDGFNIVRLGGHAGGDTGVIENTGGADVAIVTAKAVDDYSIDLSSAFTVIADVGTTINIQGYDAQFTVAAVAVPEPSSTALLGLGGLALILRRRK